MKFQQRNVSLQTPALRDDVKLLDNELNQVDYTIPASLPTDEALAQWFGQSTESAVLDFQAKNGLPTTGIVDGPTAQKIDASVVAPQPPTPPDGQPIVVPGPDPTVRTGPFTPSRQLRHEDTTLSCAPARGPWKEGCAMRRL